MCACDSELKRHRAGKRREKNHSQMVEAVTGDGETARRISQESYTNGAQFCDRMKLGCVLEVDSWRLVGDIRVTT